jgi:hypothetical protein
MLAEIVSMSHTEGALPISRAHVLANAVKVCLAGTLFLLSVVASAQPFPSYLLDTLPVYGPDGDEPSEPRIAICDSQIVVAWLGRAQRACRISEDLTPLDTIPINIASLRPSRGEHAIASSGHGYLAVWDSEDGDSLGWCLAGALVSMSGEVQDWFRIAVDITPRERPAVAFDGENYLVLWDAYYDWAWCIEYTRVSQSGEVLDPRRRLRPTGMQTLASVQYAAGEYFVSYAETYGPPYTNDVCFSRIRPDGTVVDTAKHLLRDGALESTVAWTGSSFLVVSLDEDTSLLTAARVSPDGTVLDSGIVIAHEPAMGRPEVACHGHTALAVWCSSDGVSYGYVQCSRLDSLAQPLDSVPLLLSDTTFSGRRLDVASVDNGFLVTWAQATHGNSDIVARRVTAGGVPVEPAPVAISLGANRQYDCDIASDGAHFLAVWSDERVPASPHTVELRGALFSPAAGRMGTSFRIAGEHQREKSVGYGGGCYLVAWIDMDYSLCAARVSTDGVVLDSPPILVSPYIQNPRAPDIAYCDGTFLLVWQADRIRGMRITSGGVMLDSAPLNLQLDNRLREMTPQVAAADGFFMVVRHLPWMHPEKFIGAVRIGIDGSILDTTTIVIGMTPLENNVPSRVTWGDGRFLVIDGSRSNRVAHLVTREGAVVGDPIDLRRAFEWAPYPLYDDLPAVWDGDHFLLVCKYMSRLPATGVAARVTSGGTLLDMPAITITCVDSLVRDQNHALAVDSSGNAAFLFFTYESTQYVTTRLRVVTFPRLVGGVAESSAAPTLVGHPSVAPNPNGGRFEVSWPGTTTGTPAVDVFDAVGRKCLSVAVPGRTSPGRASCRVDMTGFAPGIYFVRPRGEAALKVTISRR